MRERPGASCSRSRARTCSRWRSRAQDPASRSAAPASVELIPFTIRAFAAAVAVLPWGALRLLGALLGALAGGILRIRRRHVEAAMRRAGIPRPGRAAAAMYRALGTSAFEFLWMAGRRGADLRARIRPSSRPAWDAALGRGRGVVIAASHTGNWDLAACAMAREVELLVVTKRLRARGLDAFWQATRADRGVTLVEAKGALARAREVLARRGAVALMIDQVPDRARHSLRVEFLGATAFVDRAPAVLAAQTGAPLVVATARRGRRDEGDACFMEVLEVLEPPARAGPAWVEDATRRATAALDRFVRAHPSEWLWLHRRWRAPFSQ